MTLRKSEAQVTAAAKSGISERSARRIDSGKRKISPKPPRQYRTRPDPLAGVWDSVVVPILQQSASITPVGVFDHLCEFHSEQVQPKHRRTLERRIRKWRLLHGEEKDVIFRQQKQLGKLGIMDFTWADFPVTIKGQPLRHRLFHYQLPASGWGFTMVVYGGESFTALAIGLQNAFKSAQGVPLEIRTDSLSAAYNNHADETTFTEAFQSLASHYGFKPSRNNLGVAHENGAIESPNNHLKNQIRQALLIRGHHDFDSKADYESFVEAVIERRNCRVKSIFADEQRQLQSLPQFDSVNYTIHIAKVSPSSTFQLKRVTYSVPSRLIGGTLRVHLFDDSLEIYCQGERTLTLDRVHTQGHSRGHLIDYRHLIGGLMKKPRAFRGCQWREQLMPNEDYRQIWAHVDRCMTVDDASYYMVRLLNVANKSGREEAVGRFVLDGLRQGCLPTVFDCEDRFLKDEPWEVNPQVRQHALSVYQQLLEGMK